MKCLLLTFNLLCLSIIAGAQPSNIDSWCGAVQTPASLQKMDSLQQDYLDYAQAFQANAAMTMPDMVPVQVHIIRRSDGTGGLPEADFNAAFDDLNDFYINANMQFFHCSPINFVDSDAYYNFSISEEGSFYNTYGVDSVLNMIIPGGSLTTSSGGSICGYAYFPWSNGRDLIAVAASCMGSGNTFAHEVGHYFGLYHTHGKSNCGGITDELVDGSNCSSAGDDVCDTPADPGLLGLGCSGYVVNNNCEYTGGLSDANGDPFAPDVSNIMSYAPGFCRTDLSDDQYARVSFYNENARDYLTCGSSPGSSAGERCTEAIELTSDGTYSADGPSSGAGCHNCNGATHADWFYYEAAQTGQISIQSCDGGVDTRIWVYQGDCQNLIPIASGDDECQMAPSASPFASQVIMSVQAGQRYYFEWDDRWSSNGFDFDFSFSTVCPPPQSVNNTSLGYTHAKYEWQAVPGADSYDIRYRPSTSGWTVLTGITAEEHVLQNLTPCTIYEWQIRTVCNGFVSDWSGSYVFSTEGCFNNYYCYSYGASSNQWIDRVTMEEIDNISGNNYGFADFTNQSTPLQIGETYNLFLRADANDPAVQVYWRAWIDFNDDKDFNDPNEMVLEAIGGGQAVVNSDIAVPSSASVGATRMRVSMSLGGFANPCSTGQEREVEDYQIAITPSATLTIAPAFLDFPSDGGSQEVAVSSNTDWIVIENTPWLEASPDSGVNDGTVSFSVNPNLSTNSRETIAIISGTDAVDQVVTISQAASPPILNVTPLAQMVGAQAGQVNLQVQSNVNWAVGSDSPWASVSPASGNGNGTVIVDYDENTLPSQRVATLTFTSSGLPALSATLTQSSALSSIEIDPPNQLADYSAGCVDYSLTSNESWSASTNAGWVNAIQPANGNGDATVTVCFDENTSPDLRNALLTFNTTNSSALATLTQSGTNNSPPWPVTPTGTNHTVLLPDTLSASLGNLPLSPADWIGFFYEDDGQRRCAGAGQWNPGANSSVIVYGDDLQTPEKEGFDEGEFFSLRLYRAVTEDTIDIEGTFAPIGGIITHTERFAVNGLSLLDSIYAPSTTPPWPVTVTGNNHTVIIPQNLASDIDGQPLEEQDWIGIFYSVGDSSKCGGAGQWNSMANSVIPVYGDDLQTPEKDGFDSGETFTVKIWRASEDTTYEASAVYAPLSNLITRTNTYLANGISQINELQVDLEVSLDIPLETGWNMISSWVIPENTGLSALFGPVLDDIIIVKDAAGNSFIPDFNINSIGDWDFRQGYQVKMEEDRVLAVTGQAAAEDTPLPIADGWQIIAYLRSMPSPIDLEMSDITNNLLIAKNGLGATYIPSLGIDEIGDMQPAKGYQLKATALDTLYYGPSNFAPDYPAPGAAAEVRAASAAEVRSDNNATLIIPAGLAKGWFKAGDWIAAVDETGELAGRVRYEGEHTALVVWGDDRRTEEKREGLQAGAPFFLQRLQGQQLSGPLYRPVFEARGEARYQGNAVWVLSGLEVQHPGETEAVHCAPNPAKDWLEVKFWQAEPGPASLMLYNQSGQAVLQQNHQLMQPGWQQARLNLQTLPAGNYWLQVLSGRQNLRQSIAIYR